MLPGRRGRLARLLCIEVVRAFCAVNWPMKIYPLILLVIIGCSRPEPEAQPEVDQVPIGPGTRPSALTPPDTPVSPPPGAQRADTMQDSL